MDSSQDNTKPIEESEPTSTAAESKVDPTIPDGDAMESTTTTTNNVPSPTTTTETKQSTFRQSCIDFYWKYEFLILVVLSIALAKAYPPLGEDYLAKEITASWIAVIFIFILAGLGLRTDEFANAFKQLKFNVAVQVYNFGVVSSVFFGVSRALIKFNGFPKVLAMAWLLVPASP